MIFYNFFVFFVSFVVKKHNKKAQILTVYSIYIQKEKINHEI